jgi:hypothetical protein
MAMTMMMMMTMTMTMMMTTMRILEQQTNDLGRQQKKLARQFQTPNTLDLAP